MQLSISIKPFTRLSLFIIGLFVISSNPVFAQKSEIIDNQNEYGGKTIEYNREDFSIFLVFYDADGNLAKEETIFTSDYQIDNNLTRLSVYYYFGKKIKEERRYSSSFSNRTLLKSSIDHFDRNTGELIKRENHFIKPFTEYNVIYRENGRKKIIEWHYPDNSEGISKNISYLDDHEQVVKTETFYAEKTIAEEGYLKRVYYSSYNTNRYMRKNRQEWYYSDDYAKAHKGISKKVELFHYALGKPLRIETIFYDQHNNLVKAP